MLSLRPKQSRIQDLVYFLNSENTFSPLMHFSIIVHRNFYCSFVRCYQICFFFISQVNHFLEITVIQIILKASMFSNKVLQCYVMLGVCDFNCFSQVV